MTVISEKLREGDVLAFEEDAGYSRESVTIGSGAGNLTKGAVLGKKTADGKYFLSGTAASDGTENAAAVLLDDVDAASEDKTAMVVNRHAIVKRSGLNYHTEVDDDAKKAAKHDALKDLGVRVQADEA